MRIRVLTHTSKGKLISIADECSKLFEADKATDVIPPAYPCDGERLVVVVVTAKANMPEVFCRTIRAFKRGMAHNVAFIVDGTPELAAPIIDMAKTNDSNVIDNVLYIDGGLPFKFLKKVSAEEMDRVHKWIDEVRAAMV